MPADTRPLPYQPALDGVRAVAVVAVLLYHGGVDATRGGFLGVDIFFVLSGYLITTLLLREHTRTGTIALTAFWARRARRLLPALFLVLLFVAAYAAFAATNGELARLRADALATLAYVANWRFIFSGDSYFDQFAAPSPLRHAWSLAIEEQWYIVWPPLLMVLLRRTRDRRAVAVAATGALAIASAVLAYVLFDPGADPSRVYYGTDTRAQALLVGALLAFALDGRAQHWLHRHARVVDAAGIGGAIVLVLAITQLADDSDALYRGGFAVVAIAAAALVMAAVQPSGLVRRSLAWSPLTTIGLVSYGLYLWHWPIYVWLDTERTGWSGNRLLVLRLGVTAVVATVSFVVVERPVRMRQWPRIPLGRIAAPAGAAAVALAIVATTTGASSGPTQAEIAAIARARRNAAVPIADVNKVPRVLLVGDSVAYTLGENGPMDVTYYSVATAWGARWRTDAHIGCGVARGFIVDDGRVGKDRNHCGYWVDAWPKLVDDYDPDLAVVMSGAWEVLDHQVDGTTLTVGSSAYARHLRREYTTAARILHSRGARVLFTAVPCYDAPPDRPGAAQRNDERRAAAVNDAINAVARAEPYVDVFDVTEFLCPHGRFRKEAQGVELRPDGLHYTKASAMVMWDWMGPRLTRLGHAATAARGHPEGRV